MDADAGMKLESLEQCIPMRAYLVRCPTPEADHMHMYIGVANDLPPALGELVFWVEEDETYFRPLEEALLCLN